MRSRIFYFDCFNTWYGDDGSTTEGGGTDEGNAGGTENQESKSFSQEQVDKILQERLSREQKKIQTMAQQLKTLEQTANLTKEERDTFQKQMQDLEESYMTEQEKAAKKQQELEKKYTSELNNTLQERDTWKSRFEDAQITQALVNAASENKAVSAEQLQMMFRGSASLQPVMSEDGKETGSFTPMLKFQALDEEKNLVDMELPIAKAVAKIKEDGRHANLFQHSSTGGTGQLPTGSGSGPKGAPDPNSYSTPEEYSKAYQAWRNKYSLDGSPLQEK